jgi:hypothetical protein
MWAPDDFPGADNVPWPLLIRARFAHQVDSLVASVVIDRLSRAASVDLLRDLATAAHQVSRKGEELPADQHVEVLRAFADFDDICPPWWPRRWPPRPKGLEDLFDPAVNEILEASIALVGTAGSGELQGEFRSVLERSIARG